MSKEDLFIGIDTVKYSYSYDYWDTKSETLKLSIYNILYELCYTFGSKYKNIHICSNCITYLDRISILACTKLTYYDDTIKLHGFIPYKYIKNDYRGNTLELYKNILNMCEIVYVDTVKDYKVSGIALGYGCKEKLVNSKMYLYNKCDIIISLGNDNDLPYSLNYSINELNKLSYKGSLILNTHEEIMNYIHYVYEDVKTVLVVYKSKYVCECVVNIFKEVYPKINIITNSIDKRNNTICKHTIIAYSEFIHLPIRTHLNALFNYGGLTW